MSLLISLLFSISIFSRDIIQIQYLPRHSQKARLVKSIFQETYSIPKQLLNTRRRTNCQQSKEAIIQLCINKKGELQVLSFPDKKILNSLLIFKQKVDTNDT